MPTSSEIRQQFVDFFVEKAGHTAVPSSPVVPHNDPTLLFTNAGMNQFKDVFLGQGDRPYTRAVDTQKCIRAGGKHNDLDDVGKDTYHHTFFEMLGNWSFGDYFKKDAIGWAWQLLVEVWGLDPSRLHATFFQGDTSENLAADDEARQLWRQYLPDSQIHPGNKKDNFWEMGDSGPCGPSSEIHYDRTPDKSGAKLVNAGSPDVIEIWNLVFIQFNRTTAGLLQPLPAKHVDTGMGFERLCAVLQGKSSNYDTDVFTPLFRAIQQVTGAPAYTGDLKKPQDIAYRVIADHIRCLTFALTDGAHCGNDGRDYVLRSILRRAVRYGRQTLGKTEPFFYKLVPAVVESFKGPFPELARNPQQVAEEIREEEEAFSRTLDRGIALFDEAAQRASGKTISGEDAFRLHDTYGFPFTLTKLMAEERGLAVDETGFRQEMEKARERSRAGGGGFDEKAALNDLVQQARFEPTHFIGYETSEVAAEAMPLRVFKHGPEGFVEVEQARQGDRVAVVVGRTPFYGEAGGQVGDSGVLQVSCGGRVKIEDTQRLGDVYFHLGTVVSGPLAAGESAPVALAVDKVRRHRIMCNHTITHVMNRALRDHVNAETMQKGSLVDQDRLRFDFSHGKALTPEQIEAVEQQVNRDITADLPVHYQIAPQEEALKIRGLRAVFGEKYPPNVRVVSIGRSVKDLLAEPESDEWAQVSIEFCGGTHLKSTGEAEGFVIVGEEAVAKGVRRITAITGEPAHRASAEADRLLHRVEALLEGPVEERRDELEGLNNEINQATLPLGRKTQLQQKFQELMRRMKEHEKQRGKEGAQTAIEAAREVAEQADDRLVVARIDGADANALRSAMDVVRKRRPKAALLLAGEAEGKVSLVASVPDAMIKQGLKAGDWVREVAKVVGGGGGGRPDMAQAGGKDPTKIDEALQTARSFAQQKI